MGLKSFARGVGLGLGMMYFLDPDRGRRRRALAADQWDRTVHATQDYWDKARRDLQNRAGGLRAEFGSLTHGGAADDRVIRERVRAKLGRHVSHPHAIRIEAHDGQVVLSGQVLADEVPQLVQAVGMVRGVRGVQNRLESHRQAGNLSALQGGRPVTGEPPEGMQDRWTPGTRLLVQAAGVTLMANCLIRRSFSSMLWGTLGFGLFTRATSNRTFGELTGTSSHGRSCHFQRTVTIHAPVERVWEFMTDYERMAEFIPGVTAVERTGDNRIRWMMTLPGGMEMRFEEELIESTEHERLEWCSLPGAPVAYHGRIRLERDGEQATRLHVTFDYSPPGGALAGMLARLFGADPEHLFQYALMRAKSWLETGNPPRGVEATAASHEQNS